MKRRPQWDNSIDDPDKYRLSYAEQLNRKASYVSKNKEAAREELRRKQELLSKGIIPEEMKVAIAPQKKAPVVSKPTRNTPNRPATAQANPKSFNQGRTYAKLNTVTPCRPAQVRITNPSGSTSQVDTINRLDLAMKELEQAMTKAMESPEEAKSETSFNLSSDEEPDTEKHNVRMSMGTVEAPQYDIDRCDDRFNIDNYIEEDKIQKEYYEIPESNALLTEDYGRIEYEMPDDKENEPDYLAALLAKTKKDLEAMNVPDVPFEETPEEPVQFHIPYEDELMPRQFKLQPIQQAGAPRSSVRSIALTDNVKQVNIQTRRFII